MQIEHAQRKDSARPTLTRRRAIVAAGAAALLARGPARGQQPRGQQQPLLRIVYFEDFAPISFRGADGRMTGVIVEILEFILGQGLGIPLSHEGYPWPRAQEMVRTGAADAFCTNETAARQVYASFGSEPTLRTGTAVFYSPNSPRKADIEHISGLADLEGFVQGDYRGNGFAERAFKGRPIDWAPRLDNVMEKIVSGRNDIYIGNDLAGLYAARRAGLHGKVATFPTSGFGEPSVFKFGLRKDYTDCSSIVERVDAALRSLPENRLLEIRDRFL